MGKKKIKEAIDYGTNPERMGKSTERKAADPNSLYGSSPAMKRGPEDVEKLIGNRFKKITEHLKQVTGINDLSSGHVQRMLMGEMMGNLVPQVTQIESSNKEALEKLAIESCLDETDIPSNWFIIDAELGMERIDNSKFRYNKETDTEDNDENPENPESVNIPSFELSDLTPKEELELEKHKRNLINAIVQGAAKKAHHLYEKPEVKSKLDQIDPRLYPSYRKIMSITDFMYFTMDDMIDRLSETGSGITGQNYLEDINDNEGNGGEGNGGEEENHGEADTRIVATGFIFPVLCHEIVKGIKEASARHGLPQNPNMAQKVMGQTDILSNEPMQMKIGPEIVERLRNLLPDEMFEPENKGIIPWFEKLLYEIPAKEFLNLIGDIISDDTRRNDLVKRRFIEIMNEAKTHKSEYENYSDDEQSNPDTGDELGGMLNDLGIDLPK